MPASPSLIGSISRRIGRRKDQARRHNAKIPGTIAFQTKPEIALEQIKAARMAGLPQGVVLMDAGYGNDTRLRTEIGTLGMSYVAGIGPNTSVCVVSAKREVVDAPRCR